MTTSLWIFLAIAILFGIAYVLFFRNKFRQSQELDKKIDFSKITEWKDEDRDK